MRSGRTSKSKDYVTKPIIISKNLAFQTPQHIVVTNTVDFCSIDGYKLNFSQW